LGEYGLMGRITEVREHLLKRARPTRSVGRMYGVPSGPAVGGLVHARSGISRDVAGTDQYIVGVPRLNEEGADGRGTGKIIADGHERNRKEQVESAPQSAARGTDPERRDSLCIIVGIGRLPDAARLMMDVVGIEVAIADLLPSVRAERGRKCRRRSGGTERARRRRGGTLPRGVTLPGHRERLARRPLQFFRRSPALPLTTQILGIFFFEARRNLPRQARAFDRFAWRCLWPAIDRRGRVLRVVRARYDRPVEQGMQIAAIPRLILERGPRELCPGRRRCDRNDDGNQKERRLQRVAHADRSVLESRSRKLHLHDATFQDFPYRNNCRIDVGQAPGETIGAP